MRTIPDKIELTSEEINNIYDAGCRDGISHSYYSAAYSVDEVIHDILNKGVSWEDDDYIDYRDIKEWLKKGE
jgi:hypothetical protein